MFEFLAAISTVEITLVLLIAAIVSLVIYRRQSQKNRRVKISKRVKRPNFNSCDFRAVQIDGELYCDEHGEEVPVLLNPADDTLDDESNELKNVPPFVKSATQQQVDMFGGTPEPAPIGRYKSGGKTKPNPEISGDFIIINLQANKDKPFIGVSLFEKLQENNLRFGEDDIFHYHPDDASEAWFKMANGVNPGSFDYVQQQQFSTPVLCFILELQKDKVNQQGFYTNAYNQMIMTIQALKQEFGGRVQDSGHSDLNEQGIEHYRQKVQNFERQSLIFT